MPTYEYTCDECNNSIEIAQRFAEEPLVTCPDCGEATLYRVIHIPIVIIQGEAQTLGLQSYRNTKKMSKDQYAEKLAQQNAGKKKEPDPPFWRADGEKVDMSLNNMTPEQTKTYIETGVRYDRKDSRKSSETDS